MNKFKKVVILPAENGFVLNVYEETDDEISRVLVVSTAADVSKVIKKALLTKQEVKTSLAINPQKENTPVPEPKNVTEDTFDAINKAHRWTCDECGFINKASLKKCIDCEAPRV